MSDANLKHNKPDTAPRYWQLSELIFDSQLRRLGNKDTTLTLEPKVNALLCYLLTTPDHFASHQQLLLHVWDGRVVSDSAMQRVVSQLRKAFAELLPGKVVVQTLNKSGYRLQMTIAPLSDAADAVTASTRQSTPWRYKVSLAGVVLLAGLVALFWLYSPTPEPAALTASPVSSLPGLEYNLTGSEKKQLLYFHYQQRHSELTLQQGDLIKVLNTPPELNFAAISPDGQQLAVRLQDNTCQIALAELSDNILAEHLIPLFSCTMDSQLKLFWSSDQTGLYYRQRQDKSKPYQWYFYSFTNQQHTQLSLNPDVIGSNGDMAMALAADNKQFAIARYISAQQTALMLFHRDTLQQISKVVLPVPVQSMVWHSERQLILASSEQLYHYDLSNQKLSLLHHAGDYINSLFLHQDTLYYAVSRQYGDIWQHDLANSSAKPLQNSSRHDAMPRLSPDHKKLAFLSTRQGPYQLWLSHDNQAPRWLADINPTAGFVQLSWSADSRYLFYSQQLAAYQVDSETGATQQVLAPEHKVFFVAPDDKGGLLYSSSKSGDWQLWYFNPQTQQHQQLTTTGGYSGKILANQLFYTKYHQDGLWLRNLDTAEEQLLIADFDKINWLNWQLKADHIVFYRPALNAGAQMAGIWRYRLSDNTQQLIWPAGDDFVHQFQLIGQSLLLVQRQMAHGDIYRLNLK
ncbi:winged helix-turn-helix domain-containing protein [Rheinheimera fenheensis]|uniref:winged helix-turn-helix domain-containing protein n=1 Tax=Rheinheimera fenheensis TaxID=3152295 RepID=UPI0032607831